MAMRLLAVLLLVVCLLCHGASARKFGTNDFSGFERMTSQRSLQRKILQDQQIAAKETIKLFDEIQGESTIDEMDPRVEDSEIELKTQDPAYEEPSKGIGQKADRNHKTGVDGDQIKVEETEELEEHNVKDKEPAKLTVKAEPKLEDDEAPGVDVDVDGKGDTIRENEESKVVPNRKKPKTREEEEFEDKEEEEVESDKEDLKVGRAKSKLKVKEQEDLKEEAEEGIESKEEEDPKVEQTEKRSKVKKEEELTKEEDFAKKEEDAKVKQAKKIKMNEQDDLKEEEAQDIESTEEMQDLMVENTKEKAKVQAEEEELKEEKETKVKEEELKEEKEEDIDSLHEEEDLKVSQKKQKPKVQEEEDIELEEGGPKAKEVETKRDHKKVQQPKSDVEEESLAVGKEESKVEVKKVAKVDGKSSKFNQTLEIAQEDLQAEKKESMEEKDEEFVPTLDVNKPVGSKPGEDAGSLDGGEIDEDYPDFLEELMKFPERFQETAESVKNHISGLEKYSTQSKELFNQANQHIQESFTPLIGKEYAPFIAYVVSLSLLFLPLTLVWFFFERIRAIFSLQKILLFVNIYLSAYFATLLVAALILGSEPMDFYRRYSPSSYIFFQLLQAFGYLIYLLLQTVDLINACSTGRLAAKFSGVCQWVVVVVVGFHYYVTVFHRAMARKAPLTSWKTYGVYSLSFAILCLSARIERGKKQYAPDEEDDKTDKKN